MTKRREDAVLSEKEQELIALGASIASGCLPCTKFHLRAAASVGAAAADIAQAVQDATQVRRTATDIMAQAGGLAPADGGEARPDAGQRTLIRELVSAGAAYAINCAPGVEAHLEAARARGATDAQLLAALTIACAVRDVAVEKAKAAAAAIFGVDETHADGEDCCSDADDPAGRSGCAPEGTGGKPCRCE
jgi:AhpD family alkylhydroperoxidase